MTQTFNLSSSRSRLTFASRVVVVSGLALVAGTPAVLALARAVAARLVAHRRHRAHGVALAVYPKQRTILFLVNDIGSLGFIAFVISFTNILFMLTKESQT